MRIGWKQDDAAEIGQAIVPRDGTFDFSGHGAAVHAPVGAVLSSHGRGDQFSGRLRLDEPAVILFRMSYHPNWHATLDGRVVETMMLAPGYIGVRAGRGAHVIRMTYQSPAWTHALLFAGLTLLLSVALVEFFIARKNKRGLAAVRNRVAR